MFSDRLQKRIDATNSVLIAGFDPVLERLPKFIIENSRTNSSPLYHALTEFHTLAIRALSNIVPAIKPNLAFFEQYGLEGLRAFSTICKVAREHDLLVIGDAKRGDIGSTAQAYAAAFFGTTQAFGKTISDFEVDALTINPFLGFDTLETFIEQAEKANKGLFILVRTSNAGASDLQDATNLDGSTVSETLAEWINNRGSSLSGKCGLSGLGAVVGATHPEQARALRDKMPGQFFLIPGFGAQGGSADDAIAGFTADGRGGVINASRALFTGFSDSISTSESLITEIHRRASEFNSRINDSLKAASGRGVKDS
ncbi:MAG: orotidine-5'-phosphate decarboxylase [Bdellovibrionales bacterium]|nr:orotidine-5'-phosphate decarboxylase [Bdellovibrionales bacterium]